GLSLMCCVVQTAVSNIAAAADIHNCPAVVVCLPARPMIATLPLRPTVNNGTVLPKKGSSTLPSPAGSGSRKDASPAINKRLGKETKPI
ncbi:hypothetical protein XENOCAPTIV_000479, partial [Xenoophorus captivus]